MIARSINNLTIKIWQKLFPTLFTILYILILYVYSIANDLKEVVKALESKDRQTRLLAIKELSRIKDKEAIEILLKIALDEREDWRIKIITIRLLGEIDDIQITDRLVTIFNDPFLNEECPAIKWNTAIALGKEFNKGTRAVDSLIEALNQDNLLIKEAVIQSLGKIGDPKAILYILPLLEDKSFAIKFSAIKALENIGDSMAIPFLERFIDLTDDMLLKRQAISSLKKLRQEVVINP